jgi:hypothetical protein
MSEAYLTKDSTDISFTGRDVIGYSFEVLVSKLLDKSGIDYTANPLDDIKLWKQYQGKGSDFKIPSLNIELEAKSGYAKIFKSWILRDWITRFSYRNETRVIVVKPTLKLSDKCLELLFNYGINVVYPDSISYIVKRADKLIEAKSAKNSIAQKNSTKKSIKNTSAEKNGIENDGARTGEKTNGSTFKEISFSSKEISFDSKENSGSEPEFSGNLSVERQRFLDETLSRYPYLNKNRIKDPKECPNRKYRILVCSLKMLNPSYVCIFRVLDLIRHHRFPSYIEKKGKIYICKNPKCTGEVCRSLELTCSFLVQINKCPRMYKPPHFCLPLPKPKILPSPDLTYYLTFKEINRK